MDRIDPTILSRLTLTPASKPVGPRAIDPTPRLRMVDRQDSVELRSIPASGSPSQLKVNPDAAGTPAGAGRLVAATVSDPIDPTRLAGLPSSPLGSLGTVPSVAGSRAMKLYQNPSDQNAAATRGVAGSLIDIRA